MYYFLFIYPSYLGISRRVFGQTLKLPILIELYLYQQLGINLFVGDQIISSCFLSMFGCSFVKLDKAMSNFNKMSEYFSKPEY